MHDGVRISLATWVGGLKYILNKFKELWKTIFIDLSFLGWVPGPMIFGYLVDSACLLWEKTCSGTGECLFYDNNTLRLQTHGVPAIFMVSTQNVEML